MTRQFDVDGFRVRLRRLRSERGLTVVAMAQMCAMPTPTLEMYLYRQGLPSTPRLAMIAAGLSVTADWLLFGDDAVAKTSESATK